MKKRSATVRTDGQVLVDHIRELRTRIIVCAAVLIVGGIIGYIFYRPILEWLRSPLGANLYYNTPAGSFNFIIKVASMVGVLAAVPFIIFQLIMFIQPVFKEKLSTGRVAVYSVASILLAITGGLFAFYAILPGALKFFSGFQVAGLSALIDANSYLNFVINAIVTFIIVFQIPLLMVIIDRIKPISPKKLLAAEKYVVLGGLLVSLIVPFAMDLTTCLLIASPIIILYNLSVGMIIIRHLVARRQRARAEWPVNKRLSAEEMLLDDQLINEFFSHQSQKVPELAFDSVDETVDEHAYLELEPAIRAKTDGGDTEGASTSSAQPVVRNNAGAPTHVKPRPAAMNAELLRAEARAKREQQIAERVALYNNASMKIINDIR